MAIEIISFFLTVFFFVLCRWIYKQAKFDLLTPILTTPILLVLVLLVAHIPYGSYRAGTSIITYFLQPATVAFAVPLYQNFQLLRKNVVEMVVSICSGVVIAIVAAFFMGKVLHLNLTLIKSMVPKSITTPIAMDVSTAIGGNPTLTAVFVIITALTGITIGPVVIRLLRVRTPIAKGVLFGTSAHSAGTSKAFEYGEVEGAMSSISMIISAIVTLFIAPYLVPAL
ncbi:LrgB family protein [Alicyclobacillus fastidiosus]|uniref:LrgB family protein n=1 Tax=Alicyclobacillus fastidiosus TaxID=392011 RepID=A0ABY6ZP60_9BACL|nr:LrgB family protein [Alicyclobacillus fastidiosus]WAH43856.1 LrgB family protein [Alicyclobacillus fastidiosus]